MFDDRQWAAAAAEKLKPCVFAILNGLVEKEGCINFSLMACSDPSVLNKLEHAL